MTMLYNGNMSKINQQQAQEIINKFIRGSNNSQLALEYNLWETTIGNIIRGKCWKNCERPNNIRDLINRQHPGRPCKRLPPFTKLQEDIIIGSLLGDGTLHKPKPSENETINRNNSNFSKLQIYTKKSYLDWHFQYLNEYSSKLSPIFSKEKLVGKNKDGTIKRNSVPKYLSAYIYQTFYHPNFTELRNKWYPNNKKIVPLDLELNPQRIAIWFFDDGSNNYKQRSATLCTNAFTLEEVEFLSEKLNEFELFPTIIMQKNRPVLKFHKSSYDNLIAIIKPYMLWDCFAYKTEWRPAKKQCEVSGLFTEQQVREIVELRKIKSAKEIAKQFNVHVNHIYSLVSGRSYKHITLKLI